MSVLESITNSCIPRPSSTRWNFKSQTVNVVYELREELEKCFTQLSTSRSSETVSAAIGLKRMMRDPDFIFRLEFFSQVMPHVDIFYSQIQARNIDAVQVAECVSNFQASIQKVRDVIDTMDVASCGSATRRTEEIVEKRREAKEVCDVILSQCQERFQFTGHFEASRLLESCNFADFAKQFPVGIVNSITTFYPCLSKQKLQSELEVLYSRPDLNSFKSLSGLLKSFVVLNLTETFCELTKLIKILITTPMTTAESERSFSTLKRIKTFLRNTMLNERLNALAMLSIEKQMISEMKNFNNTVIDVFATSKNRRLELIFK